MAEFRSRVTSEAGQSALLAFAQSRCGGLSADLIRAARQVIDRTGTLLVAAIYHGPACATCHILTGEGWVDPCEAQLELDADTAEAMLVIQKSGARIGELLADSWPNDPGPVRIGIFSEGSIAAFAPSRPDPLDEGWLDAMRSGQLQLVTLGTETGAEPQAN